MQLIEKCIKKIETMTMKKEHEYLQDNGNTESLLEEYWKPDAHERFYKKQPPLCHKGSSERYYDLSIIIPVYNSEKYLKKCLDSVINQECIYRIQIILVNDGSTDSSAYIMSCYKDYRIPGKDLVVIHQENGGLSAARNAGLARAEGEYLMFLDSDDSLSKFCVQKALAKAKEEHADCVQVQYIEKTGNVMHPGPHIQEGVYTEYSQICQVPGFATMKVFRAGLFDGVWFPENYWFEDTLIHLRVFPKCRKVIVIPEKGYIYLKNMNGITQSRDGKERSVETVLVVPKVILKGYYPEGYLDELIRHFSSLSYNRLKYLPENIIKLAFLEACRIIMNIEQKPSDRYQELYEAFLNKDYGIWKWYCCRKEDK